jgi:hypothetical protein
MTETETPSLPDEAAYRAFMGELAKSLIQQHDSGRFPEDVAKLIDRDWWSTNLPSLEELENLGFEGPKHASRFRSLETFDHFDMLRDLDRGQRLWFIREIFTHKFAWAVPCREAVEIIVKHCPRIVELAAGTGLWATILRRAGADVVPTEPLTNTRSLQIGSFTDRVDLDGLAAARAYPDRDILCIWPHQDAEWLTQACEELAPGRAVAYIGETHATCAPDSFFDLIRNERRFETIDGMVMPRFPGMRDVLIIARKIA